MFHVVLSNTIMGKERSAGRMALNPLFVICYLHATPTLRPHPRIRPGAGPPSPFRGCVLIGHPGQVPRSGMRAGIQSDPISLRLSGFPFDASTLPFGREPFDKLRVPSRVEELKAERLSIDREPVKRPVEPRISSTTGGLVRNDG